MSQRADSRWGGAGLEGQDRTRNNRALEHLEEEPEQTLRGTRPGRGRPEAADSTLSEGRGAPRRTAARSLICTPHPGVPGWPVPSRHSLCRLDLCG